MYVIVVLYVHITHKPFLQSGTTGNPKGTMLSHDNVRMFIGLFYINAVPVGICMYTVHLFAWDSSA